jgi:hypothetical protein
MQLGLPHGIGIICSRYYQTWLHWLDSSFSNKSSQSSWLWIEIASNIAISIKLRSVSIDNRVVLFESDRALSLSWPRKVAQNFDNFSFCRRFTYSYSRMSSLSLPSTEDFQESSVFFERAVIGQRTCKSLTLSEIRLTCRFIGWVTFYRKCRFCM